jgi:acetyl-CoA C-acetyltransferase
MQIDPIVIVGMARTPMGAFLGSFKDIPAPKLGATAIQAAVERAGLQPTDIDEVLMGCVLPAGLGQAPARQASLSAGLPASTGCTTINKVCGSGMKTVMLAHDMLLAGNNSIFVAGGMENMSQAPYLLPKARQGARMGHTQMVDHMFFDGLEDAYEAGRLMGTFAEDCAAHYHLSREAQDQLAITSLQRAQQATADGSFTFEIAPVTITTRQGETIVALDEPPGLAKIDKIPTLKPAFKKENGTVTAANSSSISDGAAALVLMRQSEAKKRGLKPLAKIVAHSTHSQKPHWFTTAPIGAIEKLLAKTGWSASEVDLFEINEAFAVVALVTMQGLGLSYDKVNIHGGACALGHPIGASGARVIVTLIAALQKYGLKRGIASLCIGGGEATALGIEIL